MPIEPDEIPKISLPAPDQSSDMSERRSEQSLRDVARRILGATCACYGEAYGDPRCDDSVKENEDQVIAILEEIEYRPPPKIEVIMEGMVLVGAKPRRLSDVIARVIELEAKL